MCCRRAIASIFFCLSLSYPVSAFRGYGGGVMYPPRMMGYNKPNLYTPPIIVNEASQAPSPVPIQISLSLPSAPAPSPFAPSPSPFGLPPSPFPPAQAPMMMLPNLLSLIPAQQQRNQLPPPYSSAPAPYGGYYGAAPVPSPYGEYYDAPVPYGMYYGLAPAPSPYGAAPNSMTGSGLSFSNSPQSPITILQSQYDSNKLGPQIPRRDPPSEESTRELDMDRNVETPEDNEIKS